MSPFIGGTVIMPTIAEALAIAIQHQRAGRLRESETIYRQILAADPNHHDAWHLLGLIACQVGNASSRSRVHPACSDAQT